MKHKWTEDELIKELARILVNLGECEEAESYDRAKELMYSLVKK